MKKKKQSVKVKTNLELFMSIRKDWGKVNPCTKVIPDKKNTYSRKEKHKNSWKESY